MHVPNIFTMSLLAQPIAVGRMACSGYIVGSQWKRFTENIENSEEILNENA